MKNPYDGLAVLVIDMQGFWIRKLFDKARAKALIRRQEEVLRLCAEHDIPVWCIELHPKEDGPTIKPLREAIRRVPRDWYHHKFWDNAFRDKNGAALQDALRGQNVRTIYLMGINAGHCVYLTARGALRRGFEVATGDDVIDCAWRLEKALAWFRRRTQMIPFEELLRSLALRSADGRGGNVCPSRMRTWP